MMTDESYRGGFHVVLPFRRRRAGGRVLRSALGGRGAAKTGVEGVRRSPARLPDGRGNRAHGQEARSADRRPLLDPDVSVDAAWRREGDDRAGPGRSSPSLRQAASRWAPWAPWWTDRKSTRLNSSHLVISYAVFCLKKTKS